MLKMNAESEALIEEEYAFIVKREQFGDRFIAGTPQWISWVLLSGNSSIYKRKLRETSRSVLIDAGAIAPTNLTSGRIGYIINDAPRRIKDRFVMTLRHFVAVGDNEMIAMQKAAIASMPVDLRIGDNYQRLWTMMKWRPDDWSYPKKLTFEITKGGKSRSITK